MDYYNADSKYIVGWLVIAGVAVLAVVGVVGWIAYGLFN